MATIQGIYVALFGRPADPLGLAYFNEVTNDGADLTAIGDLAGTAEYQDRFEGMSNSQIVTAIYQSLFGRNPELAGLEYFVNELNSGRQTINTVAINILDGAQGADADIVANKEAAANLFTAAIAADADALAKYDGATGIAAGVSFLSGITADEASVPTQAEVEASVEAFGEGTTTIGDTFTLSTDVDVFPGTDANDTFNATTGGFGANGATLNSFDDIDGGAGIDTLNIISRGGADVEVPVGASIRNVEIINVLNANGNYVNAAGFQGVQQVWQIGGAGNIDGLAAGTTAGFRDTGVNDSVGYAAGATAASIVLDGVTTGSTLTVNGAGLTSLSISGSVANAAGATAAQRADPRNTEINVNGPTGTGDFDDITDINVAFTSSTTVDLDNNFRGLVNFDASASTGGVYVELDRSDYTTPGDVFAALETITMGSGNDVVIAGGADQDDLVVELGAGNDTLYLHGNSEGATITLGEGSDRMQFHSTLSNISDADRADFEADIISITDFNGAAAGDLLVFAAASATTTGGASTLGDGPVTLDNNQLNAVATADSLFDALSIVAGVTNAQTTDTWAVFQYDGNTYIYNDVGADGFTVGDGLVELVGFTGAFNSANFAVGS